MTGAVTPRPPAIPSDRERSRSLGEGKAVGLFMSSDHRYWFNSEGPLPSVTSILRVLDKPALTAWYKRQVAESAVLGYDHWKDLAAEDAVKWLTSMPNAQRDRAAERGTEIHGLVDAAGRAPQGGTALPVSQEYADTLAAFAGFLQAQGGSQAMNAEGVASPPVIVSSEKAILNLSEGYAGTFDLLMQVKGELWLIDVKTGKGVYPDYALQLAGYGMAEHIALPGDPTLYPFPEPARYGVLHLRPEKYPDTGYRLLEYSITDRERLAFLAALELWRWMQAHKQ